ncbi:MAG: Rossmann-like and DUF2520 domain-containing protein [Actinomycetota bacterium]
MDLAVIGGGRVGTALAVLLTRAGHRVAAVSGRDGTAARAGRFLPGVPVLAEAEAAGQAAVVLLGVPDALVVATAARVAPALRSGAAIVHLSGALGMAALQPAEAAGATPIALHPLQTFPTVESAVERMPGSAAAVTARTEEAFALGEGLARDAGALPFRLADEARPLYHAGAVLASNAVVALVALAERVLGEAGVDEPVRKFLPLTRASVENAGALGPADALTGPVVRGDAETVERNLHALGELAPEAVAAYVALASAASAVAAGARRLSEHDRAAIEEVLARWR